MTPADPLTTYALLRQRLTQPVTVTDNIVKEFIAVYDHAVELRAELNAAQAIVRSQSAKLTEQGQCLSHDRQLEARLTALEHQHRDLAQTVHALLDVDAETDPDRAGRY